MARVPHRDMSLIRPLPGGLPLKDQTVSTVPYGCRIHTMQITNFPRWEFVVVMAAPYNGINNELWSAFFGRIRADTENIMTRKSPGRPRDADTLALLLPKVGASRMNITKCGVHSCQSSSPEVLNHTHIHRDTYRKASSSFSE
jgi:hypothetical protein